MGVLTQSPRPLFSHQNGNWTTPIAKNKSNSRSKGINSPNSMSQSFHQNIFNFPNGYDICAMSTKHMGDQTRTDMLRVQGFEPLEAVQEEVSGELPTYDTGRMLSEMLNFPVWQKVTTDILDDQIPSNYKWPQKLQPPAAAHEAEVGVLGEEEQVNENNCRNIAHNHQNFLSINAVPANSMQLSLMNPHIKLSSPPRASSLNMLLPNQSSSERHGFHLANPKTATSLDPPAQFTWVPGSSSGDVDSNKIGGIVESQGLSLSLSSSLQHLEKTGFEELRMGNGGIFFQKGEVQDSLNPYGSKNLATNQQPLHLQGMPDHSGQFHVGFGTTPGMASIMRSSEYVKAARELLEEFCCVGRGNSKNQRLTKFGGNPNSYLDGGGGVASSSSKEHPPLSALEKTEYQRRKIKLLSMLDEVDARYGRYCEQMQVMVNSFDSVMAFGAAAPYTALAQKAMSRHFRCIKDAILAQLKITCELLGEKDVTVTSGLTKGETPRLRLLEQKFRQQKALHQMGMLDPETWRPQRGLPERSVNILRAWLFEHFLHPYPTEADKHLLSRQTGLSKNQVSNWFINARVRLWKPMIEEMYQQESKEEEDTAITKEEATHEPNSQDHQSIISTQKSMHNMAATPAASAAGKRSEINATEKDPSPDTINYGQCSSGNQLVLQGATTTAAITTAATSTSASAAPHDFLPSIYHRFPASHENGMHSWGVAVDDTHHHGGINEFGTSTGACTNTASSIVRLGTPARDVSLTLGLRQSDNIPTKSRISITDFEAF